MKKRIKIAAVGKHKNIRIKFEPDYFPSNLQDATSEAILEYVLDEISKKDANPDPTTHVSFDENDSEFHNGNMHALFLEVDVNKFDFNDVFAEKNSDAIRQARLVNSSKESRQVIKYNKIIYTKVAQQNISQENTVADGQTLLLHDLTNEIVAKEQKVPIKQPNQVKTPKPAQQMNTLTNVVKKESAQAREAATREYKVTVAPSNQVKDAKPIQQVNTQTTIVQTKVIAKKSTTHLTSSANKTQMRAEKCLKQLIDLVKKNDEQKLFTPKEQEALFREHSVWRYIKSLNVANILEMEKKIASAIKSKDPIELNLYLAAIEIVVENFQKAATQKLNSNKDYEDSLAKNIRKTNSAAGTNQLFSPKENHKNLNILERLKALCELIKDFLAKLKSEHKSVSNHKFAGHNNNVFVKKEQKRKKENKEDMEGYLESINPFGRSFKQPKK